MHNTTTPQTRPAIFSCLLSGLVALSILISTVPAQSVSAAPLPSSQERPLFVPLPAVTINTGSVMLGDTFNITATFKNNGDTGYGPFIDLYIPHTGPDGVFPDEPNYDGISPASGANYTATTDTGEVLTVVTQTFPDDGSGQGCVNHPWGLDTAGFFLPVCGKAGDQIVSIKIPYGSFTSGQPPVTVTVPARLSPNANLGDALTVRGRAGFQYGRTPTIDWCCTTPVDTTIVSDSGAPITWAPHSDVIPTVVLLSKTSSNTNIATGPNNPARYTITVNVAGGQSFRDIDITDTLPDSIVYLGGLTSNPAATTVSAPPVDGLPHSGQTIQLHYDGPVTSDITVSFDYYIPEFDASGVSTAESTSTNTATVDSITWDPSDGSPPVTLTNTDIGPSSSTSNDRSITLGKDSAIAVNTGEAGATPGDIIAYTLTFEISDYFGFANLTVEDLLPDGQHYYTNASLQPALHITRDGTAENYTFNPANVTVNCNYTGGPGAECDQDDPAANDGRTTITFDLAQELRGRAVSDQVLGDYVNDGLGHANAAATGRVVFYAIIEDTYADTYPGESVRMGDTLNDTASIRGNLVDTATCSPGPCTITATIRSRSSSADVNIGRGSVEKTIVARNGALCNAFNPCTSIQIAAGDTLTYRLQYDLLTGDFFDFSLTDFLPLPIFHAQDPNTDNSNLTTWPKYTGSEVIPDAGTWMRGPADTRGLDPASVTISPSTADNSVKFSFGSYDDPVNDPKMIDLLFTVRVTAEKFGDGLKMRNSVLQQDANSPGSLSSQNTFMDVTLTEPVLVGSKSVISTDHAGVVPNPPIPAPIVFSTPGSIGAPWNTGSPLNSVYLAANPLGSGIGGIDGGDLVKFAIVIENTGSGLNGAFDITVRDILPAGYMIPVPAIGLGGFNLQIYRGDGVALDDGTGSSLQYMGASNTPLDFFDQGIRINDPVLPPGDPEYGKGACQGHDTTNGKNVILITYDLMVKPDVAPGQLLENKGQITHYSGSEGGDNYVDIPIEDSANSTIANPALAKIVTGTELNNAQNSATQAVIGELVSYRLTMTIPEGSSPDTVIVDTLDAGLAFVRQDSVTLSDPANLTVSGSTTPAITNNGQTLTWALGTVTNTANSTGIDETLTFEYTAVVLNVSSNQSGSVLSNSVRIDWNTLDADGSTVAASAGPVSAPGITVIEPTLAAVKTVNPATADAGDPVEYTITLAHAAGSQTDALDVTFSDALPRCSAGGASALNISDPVAALTVADTAGLVTAANFELAGGNAAGWTLRTPSGGSFDLPRTAGRLITIRVSGTMAYCVIPGQVLANTARVDWTSLDGDINDRSTQNTASDERRGSGTAWDDYNASSTVNVTIASAQPSKYLVQTSEAHTAGPVAPYQPTTPASAVPVAIGEIIRYRLVVSLPEGTSSNFQILDSLPNGLVFLDDNTAKAVFVSNGGITSSSYGALPIPGVTDPNCQITGSTANGLTPAIPANCSVLADNNLSLTNSSSNDGTDLFVSSSDPYIKLGSLVNNDNDADAEYVIVEFNALVDNYGGANSNDANETQFNRFRIYANNASGSLVQVGGYSNNTYHRIVEPAITNLTKTAVPAVGQAGDTITYTLTFSNANAAYNTTAFDVHITDIVPAKMAASLGALNVTSTPANCATGVDTSTSAGNNIDITIASVPVNCQVIITYPALILYTITASDVLDNTANLTYTSLPGPNGTPANPTSSVTPGASGSNTGERDGVSPGAQNDYKTSAAASVTAPDFSAIKSIVASSDSGTTGASLTIGETVRYRLAVTLPQGTFQSTILTDTLPAGFSYAGNPKLSFVADQDITEAADLAGADNDAVPPTFDVPAARVSVAGQVVTITLDDIVNNDLSNDTDDEYLIVEFDALVTDNIVNANAALKNNDFTVTATGTTATSAPVTAAIVEPVITTTKSVAPVTGVQAGDALSYTVRFTNTGSATAYDVTAQDTLAQGVAFNTAAFSGVCTFFDGAVSTPIPAAAAAAGNTITFDGIPAGSWDLPATAANAYIECTYPAVAQNSLHLHGAHTNTIDADWYSLNTGGGRHYDDSVSRPGVDGAQDTASAVFTSPAPAITKDDGGVTQTVVGNTITFTLTISGPMGTLRSAAVTDHLPAGLVYNNDAVINGLPAATPSVSAPNDGSAPVTVTWNFGDAEKTLANATIIYSARVADVTSNVNGTNLVNEVWLDHHFADDTAAPRQISSAFSTITESIITTTKSVVPATGVQAGDTLTYTVRFANTGTAIAHDVIAEDTLPAGFQFNALTSCVNQTSVAVPSQASQAGAVLTLQGSPAGSWDIPVGGYIQCIYTVNIQSNITLDGDYTNTVDADWASRDGGGRIYNDSVSRPGVDGTQDTATATVTSTGATISKDDGGVTQEVIGGKVHITLTITSPLGTLQDAKVVDTLPAGLIYDAGSQTVSSGIGAATFTASSPNDGSAAVTLTWDFGDTVVSTPTITIEYDAIVANVNANANGSHLVNEVELTYTSQGGTSRSSMDSDDFYIVEPVLTIDKEIASIDVTPDAGDTVTYRVTLAPASGSTAAAFDVHFLDTLPAAVTLVPGSVSATLNGGALGVTDNSTASVVNVLIGSIPNTTGSSVVITYSVTLNQSVTPAQLIANTGDVTWTSTPGGNPNERNGGDGPGGALNDYAAADGTSFTISDPLFSKSIALTSAPHTVDPSVAIGETITFALQITLPEGTTPSLHIPDDLPAGLQFVVGSVQVDTTGFAGTVGTVTVTPVAPPVGSGDDLDITIGSTVVTANNNDTDNSFIIRFQAAVLNEAGSQDGTALVNSAYLEVGSITTPASTAQANVVEPLLAIQKTASTASPVLGETITYNLTVNHNANSHANAFDVIISDTLNAVFLAPVNIASSSVPGGCATGVDTTNSSGQLVDVRAASLPLGCQLVVTFDTQLATPAPAIGGALPNTASVNWTSLPGADANERTGSGGVNDYSASSTQDLTFTNVDLSISKDDGLAGSPAAAGSTISYTITYGNSGSLAATGVIIHETVPAHTTFNTAASTSGWSCANGSPAGTACQLTIASVPAAATGLTAVFAVNVIDPLPAGITQTDNHVKINDDGTHGDEPTPADNEDDTTTTLDAAPDLVITKSNGVSAVTPGSALVYAIQVRNDGTQEAAGITITETVPAETTFNAAGSSPGWTGCANGDPAGTVCSYTISSLAGYTAAPAILFAVTVDSPVTAGATSIANTASIADDGSNGPDGNPTDNTATDTDALVTLPNTDLTKIIAADTPGANTTTPNAAIGEVFTYEVRFTVPTGTMDNLVMTDTLDPGLAFIGCDSLVSDTAPSNLSYTLGAGLPLTDLSAVCSAAAITSVPDPANPAYAADTSPGRRMTLNFGSLTNTGAEEHLLIRYRVAVLDVLGNQAGGSLTNTAVWTWDGALPLQKSAAPVQIVEPALGLVKVVNTPIAMVGSIVTFSLRVAQLPGSTMDAFDVILTDPIPMGLTYIPGSLQIASGPAGTVNDSNLSRLVVEWPVFPLSTSGTPTEALLTFQARVDSFPNGSSVVNTASVAWSSLPGDVSAPLSTHNIHAHERHYDPAHPADIYYVSAQATISLPEELPKTGFAPGRVTPLAAQPPDRAYDQMSGMSLSIPALGVWSQIVGVPYGAEAWDLTWLNGQVGYLEGTAFPTWEGNSGLTAHVYRADGMPGPFINLKNLHWGDRIIIQAFGSKYIYEVREVYWTAPSDLRPLRHEAKPWLTLITCQGYDEKNNSYAWRTVVRAVQVKIEAE
ncbi:MAG: isopeptide-forming domain-containing fimbrial protein [Anaerolineaceae bacterium]|nr:isopeptide-forming domain-containing fimbrial protein [Anaerolineaceae bacterium]